MMKKHSLNHLGLWLLPELSRRDIQLREFAHLLGTTSQGLSDLLRGQRFSSHTLAQWQLRFQERSIRRPFLLSAPAVSTIKSSASALKIHLRIPTIPTAFSASASCLDSGYSSI